LEIRKFWAKKNNEGIYHPLIFHSIDVGNTVSEIWANVLTSEYKNRIAKRFGLSEEDMMCFFSFWAAIHDFGKLSPAFQKQDETKKSELERLGYDFLLGGSAFHSFITSKLLFELLKESYVDTENKDFISLFTRILGGHHGIFPVASDLLKMGCRELGGSKKWNKSRRVFFDILVKIFKPPDLSKVKDYLNASEAMFLAGLITVSDWIASNQEYFPYIGESIDINEYFNISKERAKEALKKSGWLPISIQSERPKEFNYLFENKFPTKLQEDIISIFNSDNLPVFLLLEWPMGEGKTEAAFWAASQWFVREGLKGIYVALPTRATSDQMWNRTGNFLQNLLPEVKVDVALVHGLSEFIQEEIGKMSLDYLETESEEIGQITQDVESWFSDKKRALLKQFGVGTIDQAILSVLQVRHFFVRLFGLAGKTVILDEVHAYDTYTTDLMKRLIEWLSTLDCRVVLLSATLPSNKRMELINAYIGEEKAIDIKDLPYPSTIAVYNKDEIKKMHKPATENYQLKIGWIQGPEPNIVNLLKEELSKNGCAVVIMNTIGRAQKTFRRLKENLPKNIDIHLLHSRFPYEDRYIVEKKILEMYGPLDKSRRPARSILVATQVVEQSMDLDFDVMISDLAPMDLLLQRAGRLHRHDRGKRIHERRLWIIEPDIDDNGVPKVKQVAFVYEDFIVLKTFYELKKRDCIEIPGDVSELINLVYNDKIVGDGEFQNAVEKAKKKMCEGKNGDLYRAKSVEIPSPRENLKVLREKYKLLIEDDPEAHKSLRAATRLGEQTIQIICLREERKSEIELYNKIMNSQITLKNIPKLEVNNLLKRSCSVSVSNFIVKVLKEWDFSKSPLRKIGVLRYHIPLLFKNGINNYFDGFSLVLDVEMGLDVINCTTKKGDSLKI